MKERINNIKIKYSNFLYTHKKTKIALDYIICFILTFISASFIAIGFKVFMSPNVEHAETIISGGVGGLSKAVCLIFEICGSNANQYTIYAISYFILNLPIAVLSFKIGLKYGIFTIVNVIIVSLLTNFVDLDFVNLFAKNVACIIPLNGYYFQAGILARVLLAALFNGAGTVLAYYAGSSSGGVDTVAQFLSFKKRMSVGHLFLIINSCVIFLFGILTLINNLSKSSVSGIALGLQAIVFAFTYQIFVSFVIDFINRSYKKEQLQIITKHPEIIKVLFEKTYHTGTIVKAHGAYTNEDNYIIYTVVNLYETRHLIEAVQKVDPHCFVNVMSIKQIYGRFNLKKKEN